MTISVKISVFGKKSNNIAGELRKLYDKRLNQAGIQWRRESKALLEKDIPALIQAGTSPVKGQRRFKKYSPSYSDAIRKGRYKIFNKKLRPVNLTLSGKLINSFKVVEIKTGLSIKFTDYLAKIHTELGAGKARTIRKMLPSSPGEEFSRVITKKLTDLFKVKN
jgi:hypothetical protein